jgi:hypothetical protein
LGQEKEGGLEGVLGVVGAVEDATTHPPDHRAVPAHQDGEGALVAAVEELLQEVIVGQPAVRLSEMRNHPR